MRNKNLNKRQVKINMRETRVKTFTSILLLKMTIFYCIWVAILVYMDWPDFIDTRSRSKT